MSTTQKSFSKGSEFPALTPGKLRLYSMRFCPYAQRTRLVLAHKKIDFETVNVNLKDKPEWFLERNPLGLVPVLEQDDRVIYESAITCDYLDDIYQDNKLTPSEPYRRARDSILLQLFGKVVTNYYGTLRNKGEDKEVFQNFHTSLKPFEEEKGKRGAFFGGDQPSMLDFMLWPWFERLPIISKMMPGAEALPAEKFPNLNAWVEAMLSQPAVKETMFDLPTHIAFLQGYSTGKPNYDIGLNM
ncbi:glutathione S-transferase omega-1-like [Argopecten irradians]|uniref:glutathione S-transferase omega-1-like n=1 Tax=Argopecten irradians TaxID=31199 RepID=UPI003720E3A7